MRKGCIPTNHELCHHTDDVTQHERVANLDEEGVHSNNKTYWCSREWCNATNTVRVILSCICTMDSATNPRLCYALLCVILSCLCTMDSVTNPRLCYAVALQCV
jgi:hypothetical protein